MSQALIVPTATLPLFNELKPHLIAKNDLIPLKRRDKVPLHAGWPTETPLTYDEAHAHMANGGNIGVRLRPDMLVIDVDPRNFRDGVDSFEALMRRANISGASSNWPVVKTGGGGWHYYLKKPAELTVVHSLQDFPGVEFKSTGRQVVAAGSVHPEGPRYSLEPHPLFDGFQGTMPVPQALLAMIVPQPARARVEAIGAHYRCEVTQDDFASTPDAPNALLDLIARQSGGNNLASGQLSPEALATCLAGLDVRQFQDQDRFRI